MAERCGFYWLIKGQLAGAAYPAKCLEWLFNQKGIRALVSLEPLTLEVEQEAQQLGLQIASVPIEDFTAGTSEQREQAISFIDLFRTQGLPTLVHCKGGLGRTGMILALYLVKRQGLSPTAAITRVRQLRHDSIEEDTGQIEAVMEASTEDP